MRFFSVSLLLILLCGSAIADGTASLHASEPKSSRLKPLPQKPRILVFTRTEGFRHDSIPAAVAALREIANGLGWQAVHSEDAAAISTEHLRRYRVVAFANTTGDVLDDAQQDALRAYVEGGGGFIGLHSAADTEYGWAWYGELVGAWFASHPPGLQTTDAVFEGERPLRAAPWRITDELYNYRSNPRGRVRVIASVDERGYSGGTMGRDHPIAWCRQWGKGRSWYTGLGHAQAMYADETFRAHVLRGLQFAAGLSKDC